MTDSEDKAGVRSYETRLKTCFRDGIRDYLLLAYFFSKTVAPQTAQMVAIAIRSCNANMAFWSCSINLDASLQSQKV